MASLFDPVPLRAQFPAIAHSVDDPPLRYFDNPGGTQVPQMVIDAVGDYYRTSNANVGGAFGTSRRTDTVVTQARLAVADLLNAPGPETIVFGPSMTALTFHLARSMADQWTPGDEIIITTLDHDANIAPWTDLEAVGAIVKVVDIHPEDSTVDMESFAAALSPRTRLVAVTHASNAVGTIPDVGKIISMAHSVGALVFVDAVQYAPHCPIDVQSLDCDFLACSAYKFFGPHAGILYGKAEHLERLTPHKVRPAKDTIPYRWELGTLNHEGLAGITAAIGYLAQIGAHFGEQFRETYAARGFTGRRLELKTAMRAVQEYEQTLSHALLSGFARFNDIRVFGLADVSRCAERVPTVAFTWPRLSPRETVEHLGRRGICAWSGNYYAQRLMQRVGLEASGGAVRIGAAHYNTLDEIEYLMAALHDVAR